MGTNYYAIPKLDDTAKAAAVRAIQDENYSTALDIIPTKIHIGKSSMGWDFCFNHNDWRYYNDFDEMKLWLAGCEISDEYGGSVSLHAFITLVEAKRGKSVKEMSRRDWYVRKGDYFFSTSIEFS